MPAVRTPNAAGSFAAIESQRIQSEIFAPKLALKAILQPRCLMFKFPADFRVTQRCGDPGGQMLSLEDVALHFAKRDG